MVNRGKLVRDKIPAIIEAQGRKPSFCILDDAQYAQELARKLDEEVREFHADKNLEELADILEVVYALTEHLGCSKEQLLEVYEKKHAERGGFQNRVFLRVNHG